MEDLKQFEEYAEAFSKNYEDKQSFVKSVYMQGVRCYSTNNPYRVVLNMLEEKLDLFESGLIDVEDLKSSISYFKEKNNI